jgi:carbamoyl-phosphate synthase large subunit
MPKRNDIEKILIIGSGPIVIGQGAEFDYSGTQACIALKKLGYSIVLVNSNPATIMTDTNIADKIYMEPLTLEFIAKIIRMERPDALLATFGGQTALNLAMQLDQKKILTECGCELLSTNANTIEQTENRKKFKDFCKSINQPFIESGIAYSLKEAIDAAHEIGFPVVLRPAYTLGGTGGGFANNIEELIKLTELALNLSPVSQVLIEKSVYGYKEIEYEVIRDKNDTSIMICNIENVDSVGIHTGDSIVVCPSQTLNNREYQMLRSAAINIVSNLKIEGGCNVQFALDPYSCKYYVIEVNPRVSRSSALASKASGYPIAKVSALLSVGFLLEEIEMPNSCACFEPALDYIVTKIPRFAFDKFDTAKRELSTQMQSTGEVMAIGKTFEESLLKAIRSLELGIDHIYLKKISYYTTERLLNKMQIATDERIYEIAELIRRDIDVNLISKLSKIDLFFINKIKNIIILERDLTMKRFDEYILRKAKVYGFSNEFIAYLWGESPTKIFSLCQKYGIIPVYKMIDTCAGEFDAYISYFYSTY